MGVSEDKAFLSAIRKINPRHKQIQNLLQNGKQKIMEYYNSQCDFIQKEASTQSDSRNFDEAVFILSQVPKITKDCYDSSMDLSLDITKKKFEFEILLTLLVLIALNQMIILMDLFSQYLL